MQGFERMDRPFTDAEMLTGHLVPAGSMFAFLAAHRAEVFPDADYADLFAPPGCGRPSLAATRMAAVLALHDYSDRETAEAIRRWKVACGLAVDDAGFNSTAPRHSASGSRSWAAPADALPVTEEAVAAYRELAAASPDRHNPDLVTSLTNLGVYLPQCRRSWKSPVSIAENSPLD